MISHLILQRSFLLIVNKSIDFQNTNKEEYDRTKNLSSMQSIQSSLPFAVLHHLNIYVSVVYAVIIGNLVMEKISQMYFQDVMHDADLCNTLGNLVYRAMNLCGKYCMGWC